MRINRESARAHACNSVSERERVFWGQGFRDKGLGLGGRGLETENREPSLEDPLLSLLLSSNSLKMYRIVYSPGFFMNQ